MRSWSGRTLDRSTTLLAAYRLPQLDRARVPTPDFLNMQIVFFLGLSETSLLQVYRRVYAKDFKILIQSFAFSPLRDKHCDIRTNMHNI